MALERGTMWALRPERRQARHAWTLAVDGAGAPAWPLGLPLAAYLGLFLLLTWPWLLGYVTVPWDAKAQFLPQAQFLAQSLARGEAPWWNPYVFLGQPQIADPQSLIFSPPFLLLALVNGNPGPWAFDLTVLAAMALGGVGMLLWVRDQGWHFAGALVAALAFSFGAAMAWRMQHTGQVLSLAWTPWAMLLADRAILRRSLLAGLGAGLVGAAILLGRDQVALLVLYVLAGRALWLLAERWADGAPLGRPLAALALGALAALAIVAIPVAMTLALAAESNRPIIDLEGAGRGSLHPAQLITFVVPQLFGPAGHMADYWGPPSFAWRDTGLFTAQNVGQLYVGALPLLLVVGAAFAGRLWDREVRFFVVALVLVLLYALGWYTPAFQVLYKLLPGVDLYRRPADAVFVIGALVAVIAAYATHLTLREPWKRPPLILLAGVAGVLAAALVAAILLAVRVDRTDRLLWPLLIAGVAFAATVWAIVRARDRVALSPTAAALSLAGVLTADLAINNGPSTSSALPAAYYDVLAPATANDTIRLLQEAVVTGDTHRDRVELAGLGFHWPNVAMTHRLEATLGYNPVRLALTTRAIGAGDNVGAPGERRFPPLFPSYRSRLADLAGLRFIVTGVPVEAMDPRLPAGGLKLIAETADGYVYENDKALPRVLFATEAMAADFARLTETGEWPDADPARTVLLESTGPAPSPAAPAPVPGPARTRGPGTAKIVGYANNEVMIEVESPDGGFVVLNDVWHPWWQATIDGAPAPVLRANVMFRAVEVPAGKRRLVLTFRPLAGLLGRLR